MRSYFSIGCLHGCIRAPARLTDEVFPQIAGMSGLHKFSIELWVLKKKWLSVGADLEMSFRARTTVAVSPAAARLFFFLRTKYSGDRWFVFRCCWFVLVTTYIRTYVAVQGVAPTRIDVQRFMHDAEVSTWWRAEPGPLRVVATENGAGLVPLNPEGGGVVVATIKADPNVLDNESLLIYQSTKQLRIAGSGFDDDVEVSPPSLFVHFAGFSLCSLAVVRFAARSEQERVSTAVRWRCTRGTNHLFCATKCTVYITCQRRLSLKLRVHVSRGRLICLSACTAC